VEQEIADAFAFAEASPFPAAEELTSDIFKEEDHAAIRSSR
jgi:TPP-dependent pyruvate/acetoin dehydrogenase alpha subunit